MTVLRIILGDQQSLDLSALDDLDAGCDTVLIMEVMEENTHVRHHKQKIVLAELPLGIYLLQLMLNAAWAPIFFGLHRPDLALFEMVLLWLSIVATIAFFHPVHAGAAWLLLPYLIWVTFAAALNLTVWRLNPALTSSR